MRITVAIACYNLEDRISLCLESVISQDYEDLEILIVDDCSTDRSVEIVENLIRQHPEREIRIIVNQTNQGLCKVRNTSINEARGEAIFFMDGDDTIEPGTLSLFVCRMKETGVDVVCGSFRKTDLAGNTILTKQFPEDTFKGNFAYSQYIEKHITGFFWLPLWNNLYRLDFLRSNDIYCATHYRKYELCLFTFKVILNATGVSYINKVTYNWCDIPSSITNAIKKNIDLLRNFRVVIESLIDAKNDFLSRHDIKQLPPGASFLINYVILTQGYLKSAMQSAVISKAEKRQFLKWLKKTYRDNSMNLSNIVGPFNRLSYLILISPFPYLLFRFYFKHLKTVSKIVNRLVK